MFGVMQNLSVAICEDGEAASAAGYTYNVGYTPVEVTKCVVVRKGTQAGRSTVDFVMRDQAGNKYVVMITGELVKSIPCGEDEPSTFKDRLKLEKEQLDAKLAKLDHFLSTPEFGAVEIKQADLLIEQAAAMRLYSTLLGRQLADLDERGF